MLLEKMSKAIRLTLRICAVVVTFVVITFATITYGGRIHAFAASIFPALEGFPSTDPRGRGVEDSADVFGLGLTICLLLGIVGAWLAWLWTDRKWWSPDLFVASPVFLIFAFVSESNYVSFDMVFSRDAQAFLNIILAASGTTILIILARSVRPWHGNFISILSACLFGVCAYAFVFIPIWYSISYLSWKLGGDELDQWDGLVEMLSLLLSLVSAVGITWQFGRSGAIQPSPKSSKNRPGQN